jgi:hypothetical protein
MANIGARLKKDSWREELNRISDTDAKATKDKAKKTPAPEVVNSLNAVMPSSNKANYNDKIVVIKRSFFSPEYADKDRRFVVSGGFGCHAEALGTAVFGKFMLDGERTRVERYDIEGLAAVTS